MPSLLVLGGTGFIGRHIINKAASKRWEVTSASLSLPSKKKRIKKVKYYKVDLKNFSIVKRKLNKQFNYIINLAGYINHSSSKNDYSKIIQEHFISVKNIIRIVFNFIHFISLKSLVTAKLAKILDFTTFWLHLFCDLS